MGRSVYAKPQFKCDPPHPAIGEAHADVSSGAAEVYASGNAANDFLYLSYTAGECGLDFPQPLVLQVDNAAAECFINNSAFKSKLKHIDTRQHWVKVLRNREILIPQHVPSADNIADIFTKILSRDIFERLRDRIMHPLILDDEASLN